MSTLHARLLRGDDGAAAEAIIIELLPLLEQLLRRSFRTAARDAIVDAVEDALIEYIARPQRFDPERGVPLEVYLRLAAARNLQNWLRGAARRKAREQEYAAEIARCSTQTPERISPPPASIRPFVDACEAAEVGAAMAWLRGERRTKPLAKLLGLSGLADGEQRAAVKRFKDRLVKRIERLREQQNTTKKSYR